MLELKNLISEEEIKEYKYLTSHLIEYCWDNEEKHYEECEDFEQIDHIFCYIKRIKELNEIL